MAEAAAVMAVIANAIKASGVVVRVTPEDFQKILAKADKPLVVWSKSGFFSRNHQYLTSYKGFAFHTKSGPPLELSPKIETVLAEKIWIPS